MAFSSDAVLALVAFTLINALNCADRYIPSATKALLIEDLGLTDTQTGALMTGFMVLFLVTTPVVAILVDKGMPRKFFVIGGVLLWCVAAGLGALAVNFWTLLLPRCFVGVGEASYGTLAQTIISDFFPPERRALTLGIYDAAIPSGSAVGFLLGGFIGQYMGWRYAFLITAIPGLAVVLVGFLNMPVAGQSEKTGKEEKKPPPSLLATLKTLIKSPTYLFALFGNIPFAFGKGLLADWMSIFLIRDHGLTVSQAGVFAGCIAIAGGILGSVLGGVVSEKMAKKVKNPQMLVSSVGVVIASGFAVLAFFVMQDSILFVAAMLLLASISSWTSNGPILAVVVGSAPPDMRARTIGISVILVHLFGDAFSPTIAGLISDVTGDIRNAMIMYPVTLVVAGIVWFIGFWVCRHFVHKSQKATKSTRLVDLETMDT
ncbi:major facilitator superfamily protein [Pelomyxa schiedti]|nr:major facilitator superfamily protein [Pelomyxa schiedti]